MGPPGVPQATIPACYQCSYRIQTNFPPAFLWWIPPRRSALSRRGLGETFMGKWGPMQTSALDRRSRFTHESYI